MTIKGVQDYSRPFAVRVYVDGQVLGYKASCKVINHSPTGFQWGYGGSGPAQLALAILLLRTDDQTAARLHQDFKSEYVASWPKDKDFEEEINVEQWIADKGYVVEKRTVGLGDLDEDGECSFPEKCQRAEWKQCDCACGGENHGIQSKLFE